MKRTIIYDIDEAFFGVTIKSYLLSRGYTRKAITILKEKPNQIYLNGRQAFVNETVKEQDKLELLICEEEISENIVPQNLKFTMIYEDDDILVVDKPAGMPIHPSVNHHTGTLANAVAGYYANQGKTFVFRCMNRLDKETSGVTVLAKHAVSASILSKQVKEGGFTKEYRTIVCGVLPEEGTISLPIGRKEGSIIERVIDYENGKPAVTHFHRLGEAGNRYSYAAVTLETGRTHQIRVHMKAIGHPLPGDYLYHPVFEDIKRQPLHCYRMGFMHPITGERVAFVAEIPEDMRNLLTEKLY